LVYDFVLVSFNEDNQLAYQAFPRGNLKGK